MMGNVSAKQLGMLHTICMYVCMYVCMAIYTYMHNIDHGQKSNTHTTLGNILDWDLRLGLGGGDSGPRVHSNLGQDLNLGFQVLGCTVTSFKISI
jgi:hypothetical protein